MKAAVYDAPGEPEVLTYVDVPDPEPGQGEIRIKVHSIGLQGGDVRARAVEDVPGPGHIVGYQVAGFVDKLGPGVDAFEVGQRVAAIMLDGSHAELAVANASWTFALPEGMDLDKAAAVPVEFGTAHDTLFEFGGLEAGQVVLVQAAAGGFGLAAVLLAKAAGATVIGTASSPERLTRLQELGLDHGIDYTKEDVVEAVMRITGDRGVDLAIDPVGGQVLTDCIKALAYRGRVVFVGLMGGDDTPPDVMPLLYQNASLIGYYLALELQRDTDRARTVISEVLARTHAGELPVVFDKQFPLSDAAAAHRRVESREAFGRIILKP